MKYSKRTLSPSGSLSIGKCPVFRLRTDKGEKFAIILSCKAGLNPLSLALRRLSCSYPSGILLTAGVDFMQTVVNCILRQDHRILMLKKPRRGWWVAPGGKVEPGESLSEAVLREYQEETGLLPVSPQLRGVFSVILREGDRLTNHWMLFTFYTES